MRKRFLMLVAAMAATAIWAPGASAHALHHGPTDEMTLKQKEHLQVRARSHARGVIRVCARLHVTNRTCRWHRAQLRWVSRELRETRAAIRVALRPDPAPDYWVAKQIWAGNILGRESGGDPWPNCPDPYDGSGSSWSDTVACENGGNWYDSPGYYRCGLQFDPAWERRFGQLCPY